MRNLLLILFIFLSGAMAAQTLGDYEEVVYLKNGSVIRGIIVETIPNKSVKIQTHENNLFVYQFDEIEKITRELPVGASAHNAGRKNKGFNMYFDEGLALTVSGGSALPMNILTGTAGYKINHLLFIGGGVGLIARSGFASVPAFVDVRLTLTKTKIAPIVAVQVGYMTRNLLQGNVNNGYGTTVHQYGGFTFGIKPGIAINLKKDLDLNFNAGYQLGSQIIKTDIAAYYYGYGYSSAASSNTNYGLMHFFVLTAGIKF